MVARPLLAPLLLLSICLHHATIIEGFTTQRTISRRPPLLTATEFSATHSNDSIGGSACPFSKSFPKYRIDFSKIDKEKGFNLLGGLQKSLSKSQLEEKFKGTAKIEWIDETIPTVSVFSKLWTSADSLYSFEETNQVVLGLTDSSHAQVAQRFVDILNWMQSETTLENVRGSTTIQATIHREGPSVAIDLVRKGNPELIKTNEFIDPEILNKRTQSWVQRILVEQGICPFTKSAKISGQGLGDLGIPVARIHYCSTNAGVNQFCKLMAATWSEIGFMLEMGDRGKKGISSILLAAPGFDDNFDLWSGPMFAMLESGVIACELESQIGVVCFHPRYATPDGKSFPGFGHMHSVPRLKKWLTEHDKFLSDRLSDDEIAAGGAWQRRTPHATVNVLRAEQLQAAEGRRVTGELYTENIRKLVGKPDGIGSEKLMKDLEQERSMTR